MPTVVPHDMADLFLVRSSKTLAEGATCRGKPPRLVGSQLGRILARRRQDHPCGRSLRTKFVSAGCVNTMAPLSFVPNAAISSGVFPATTTGAPTISPGVEFDQPSAYPSKGTYRGSIISSVSFSNVHPRPNFHGSSLAFSSPYRASLSRTNSAARLCAGDAVSRGQGDDGTVGGEEARQGQGTQGEMRRAGRIASASPFASGASTAAPGRGRALGRAGPVAINYSAGLRPRSRPRPPNN